MSVRMFRSADQKVLRSRAYRPNPMMLIVVPTPREFISESSFSANVAGTEPLKMVVSWPFCGMSTLSTARLPCVPI